MQKNKDMKNLLIIMTIGFSLNFLMGLIGSFFKPESFAQMTCWQIGDASAIMASILASRYIGSRGAHLVPAGFTILYIAYGVSFASSTFEHINEEKMATVVLPLVPSLFLIGLGKFFPTWLRILSILVIVPFMIIYFNVINHNYNFDDISNGIAYIGIQTLGVLWSIFMWKDFLKNNK